MKIITISGLDGSGKSTQIKLLQEYLESQGKKVFYFHAGQFSIGKTYNVLRPHKVIAGKHKESISKASWPKIQLRKMALLIDVWRFKLLCKKLQKNGYDYILSDRYFYDSIVNIEYLSREVFNEFLFIPKVDISFYLKVDPELIMKRDRIPDQGLDYLMSKEKILNEKTDLWNWNIVNGNRDKEEVFEEIKKYAIAQD